MWSKIGSLPSVQTWKWNSVFQKLYTNWAVLVSCLSGKFLWLTNRVPPKPPCKGNVYDSRVLMLNQHSCMVLLIALEPSAIRQDHRRSQEALSKPPRSLHHHASCSWSCSTPVGVGCGSCHRRTRCSKSKRHRTDYQTWSSCALECDPQTHSGTRGTRLPDMLRDSAQRSGRTEG